MPGKWIKGEILENFSGKTPTRAKTLTKCNGSSPWYTVFCSCFCPKKQQKVRFYTISGKLPYTRATIFTKVTFFPPGCSFFAFVSGKWRRGEILENISGKTPTRARTLTKCNGSSAWYTVFCSCFCPKKQQKVRFYTISGKLPYTPERQ